MIYYDLSFQFYALNISEILKSWTLRYFNEKLLCFYILSQFYSSLNNHWGS